eukprot:TCONS_00002395-protein
MLKLIVAFWILSIVQADFVNTANKENDPLFIANFFRKNKKPVYPEVPYAGSDDRKINLINLAKIKGSYYLHEIMKESGLGVYKLRLFEDRVILADPIAIHVIYNPKLVEKSKDFGLATVNGLNMRGYLPSASVNGIKKIRKKLGMLRILKSAEKKYGIEGLFKILKKHWDFVLPLIKNNQTNVDDLIHVITVRTLTEYFFDKPFDLDLKVYVIWFLRGLTPKNDPNQKLDDLGKKVTEQMYSYIDSTPWAKNHLPRLLRWDKRKNRETLKSEALFFAFIFSAFGLRSAIASTVPLYLNLDKATKSIILKEVNTFHEANGKSMDEKLEDFFITDRFVTEVFRFLPPVTQVFGRARKDFTLDSLQGRYTVKKGTYLTGYPYGAQRDPYTFRLPNLFTTTGDQSQVKENFFAFGGPYYQKARVHNRKCLGQEISLNMAKMFVALFARCDIEAVSSLKFTESNPQRVIASDEPLKVNKFKC